MGTWFDSHRMDSGLSLDDAYVGNCTVGEALTVTIQDTFEQGFIDFYADHGIVVPPILKSRPDPGHWPQILFQPWMFGGWYWDGWLWKLSSGPRHFRSLTLWVPCNTHGCSAVTRGLCQGFVGPLWCEACPSKGVGPQFPEGFVTRTCWAREPNDPGPELKCGPVYGEPVIRRILSWDYVMNVMRLNRVDSMGLFSRQYQQSPKGGLL